MALIADGATVYEPPSFRNPGSDFFYGLLEWGSPSDTAIECCLPSFRKLNPARLSYQILHWQHYLNAAIKDVFYHSKSVDGLFACKSFAGPSSHVDPGCFQRVR